MASLTDTFEETNPGSLATIVGAFTMLRPVVFVQDDCEEFGYAFPVSGDAFTIAKSKGMYSA